MLDKSLFAFYSSDSCLRISKPNILSWDWREKKDEGWFLIRWCLIYFRLLTDIFVKSHWRKASLTTASSLYLLETERIDFTFRMRVLVTECLVHSSFVLTVKTYLATCTWGYEYADASIHDRSVRLCLRINCRWIKHVPVTKFKSM